MFIVHMYVDVCNVYTLCMCVCIMCEIIIYTTGKELCETPFYVGILR